MGGIGSGRHWHLSARPTTGSCPSVTIAAVQQRERLEPGCMLFVNRVPVRLAWTPCHYGGARPWFLCPRCYRRAGRLFYGDGWAGCRRCLRLAYPSQNESPRDRWMRRASKLRERLGGSGSNLEPIPDKPPRMHWRTYARLVEGVQHYEQLGWLSVAAWLGALRTDMAELEAKATRRGLL